MREPASETRAATRLSYCAGLVREHDPERYLATLFAPAEAREALFALYAFDHEISRVRHVVSEPMAAAIRWQWWRDALDGIEAGNPLAHPVAEALAAALRGSLLSRRRLEAAIDGREAELEDAPPKELGDLEARLEATSGTIGPAAVELLGISEEPALAAAREHGLALGLVRLVQSLPDDLHRDRVLLPAALLTRHGVDLERLSQNVAGCGLRPVVAELAERARAHLAAARRDRTALPVRARVVLLSGPLLQGYLKRLARAGYDPFAAVRTRPVGRAPLTLLWHYLRGTY